MVGVTHCCATPSTAEVRELDLLRLLGDGTVGERGVADDGVVGGLAGDGDVQEERLHGRRFQALVLAESRELAGDVFRHGALGNDDGLVIVNGVIANPEIAERALGADQDGRVDVAREGRVDVGDVDDRLQVDGHVGEDKATNRYILEIVDRQNVGGGRVGLTVFGQTDVVCRILLDKEAERRGHIGRLGDECDQLQFSEGERTSGTE